MKNQKSNSSGHIMVHHPQRGLPLIRKWSVLLSGLVLSLVITACQVQPVKQPESESLPVKQTATRSASSGAVLRYDTVHHPVLARRGMVVSQNELASEVGREILEAGGNAVDAAIATGFALAVTLPRAGNIGGSGFMLIHMAEESKTIALDFRSAAPATADLSQFKDANGEIDWFTMSFGPKAPGVPGTVAGFHEAWSRYGTLPWSSLLQPAIKLAAEGIEVSDDLAYALAEARQVMSVYPSSVAAYMGADGKAPKSGSVLKQADLAWSMTELAEHGAAAFYNGSIAEKIVAFMQASGGYISAADLQNYKVRERLPISTTFNEHTVTTMPPVSGGGIAILQMLNVLSEFPMETYGAGGAESLHVIAETMKRVAANRRVNIGDPDYVRVPTATMTGKRVAQAIASDIDLSKSTPVDVLEPMDVSPYESPETTHYSVVDGAGNAVATTYTLGYSFGSGLVIPGTGILMDNQLRNFSHRVLDHANVMQAGKRMVSTMSPTLVFDPEGDLFLVTGSPGGGRIPNIVTQLIINTVQYGMNIAEATHAPRIHQQWRTPELGVEPGVSPDTIRLLRLLGHDVVEHQTMGSTQSVMIKDGYIYGAADPRRPGAAAVGID